MPKNRVDMGWGADPMKVQHPIISDDDCKHFDADNKAITRLKIRGIITPSDADRARVRYVKKVQSAIVDALAKNRKQ